MTHSCDVTSNRILVHSGGEALELLSLVELE